MALSGLVSGLEDSEGLPWQHNFADVDRTVLDDADLRRNGQWANKNVDTDDDGTIDQRLNQNAAIFYAANSGLLRPVNNVSNTFMGRLLDTRADAGSEANGTWSVGMEGGSGYLTGGFGVVHIDPATARWRLGRCDQCDPDDQHGPSVQRQCLGRGRDAHREAAEVRLGR